MIEEEINKVKIEIYTSPTCPYCPAAIRMLQKAIDIYGKEIEVTKIDITTPNGEELATYYEIKATPTIVIITIGTTKSTPRQVTFAPSDIELLEQSIPIVLVKLTSSLI